MNIIEVQNNNDKNLLWLSLSLSPKEITKLKKMNSCDKLNIRVYGLKLVHIRNKKSTYNKYTVSSRHQSIDIDLFPVFFFITIYFYRYQSINKNLYKYTNRQIIEIRVLFSFSFSVCLRINWSKTKINIMLFCVIPKIFFFFWLIDTWSIFDSIFVLSNINIKIRLNLNLILDLL